MGEIGIGIDGNGKDQDVEMVNMAVREEEEEVRRTARHQTSFD